VATTLIQNSDMSRADEYVKNCVLCKEGTSSEETHVASSVVVEGEESSGGDAKTVNSCTHVDKIVKP
jgi:hypothetical protein